MECEIYCQGHDMLGEYQLRRYSIADKDFNVMFSIIGGPNFFEYDENGYKRRIVSPLHELSGEYRDIMKDYRNWLRENGVTNFGRLKND